MEIKRPCGVIDYFAYLQEMLRARYQVFFLLAVPLFTDLKNTQELQTVNGFGLGIDQQHWPTDARIRLSFALV